jgi:predicted acylesterase/phospholipase RssA
LAKKLKLGLAFAGGGPLGAIYEIGALTALSEALDGLNFNEADIYVGVSAGGFVAAGLANGFSPQAMCRLFIESEEALTDSHDPPFNPVLLLQPALQEYWYRLRRLPGLTRQAFWRYLTQRSTLGSSLEPLSQLIPTGLFSNERIDQYLADLFSRPGRSNDFRKLRHKLVLIATDLDAGVAVEFGTPDLKHIPISRAVQASAALPGLFPPVEIEGRYFVDGALKKTLHASVALREGVNLLIALNPLVPYESHPRSGSTGPSAHSHSLIEGGLPIVLAQTFRSIVHSRMETGMARYKKLYPEADIVLIEPNRTDADMFFTNMFSYSSRRHLCEHAYQKTRHELKCRASELEPLFAKYGVKLNLKVLNDASLTLVRQITPVDRRLTTLGRTTSQLERRLDDLEKKLRLLKHRAESA